MKRTILFLVSPGFRNPAAFAQYPAKPIRIVGALPRGRIQVDATARLVAQVVVGALGQAILWWITARRSGRTIGSEAVAKSAPDGYTLLWGNVGPLAIGPASTRSSATTSPGISSRCRSSRSCLSCCLRARYCRRIPWSSSLGLCRAHPGDDHFGSTGIGSGLHLIGELFKSEAAIQIVHVPYKGVAQALPEMMSGKVQIAFNTIPAFLPHVKSGRLKALVNHLALRSPLLAERPDDARSGAPRRARRVPARRGRARPGTTRAIIERLKTGRSSQRSAVPEIAQHLVAQGARPVGSSPEELRTFMREGAAKWLA